MFVSGIVIEYRMDPLAGRDLALDGIEKADEFAVAMALRTAPDHRPIEQQPVPPHSDN
jgi:hypothetical protein